MRSVITALQEAPERAGHCLVPVKGLEAGQLSFLSFSFPFGVVAQMGLLPLAISVSNGRLLLTNFGRPTCDTRTFLVALWAFSATP